ncbi:hypothetical protein FSP39_021045 [Pinctada imbricata]|uniref:F-box domain-containing protein n=1 Tax=Pinctada imbricata TaxID=66713 RepID=A0AA89C5R6_PINIB|nr:hypothetical protein FSP39_021045 [Pinctada imbricata]
MGDNVDIGNSDQEEGPDYSLLPSVAWVKILSNLSLGDRYNASQTCHALFDTFNHPSLWHTMRFDILGNASCWTFNWWTGREDEEQENSVPEKYISMVTKFGRFFQNLTISVSGFLHSDFGRWNDILSEIAKQCRLEKLTLAVGNLTTRTHLDGKGPEKKNVIALVDLVRNAFRMKSFQLLSWPIYPSTMDDPDANIFQALKENPKLKDLEELSLFWCEQSYWSERTPLLLSPEKTLGIIEHFKSLTSLSLRSPMLDESIFQELCSVNRNAKLQLLRIFLNYNKHLENFAVPEISSRTWEQLLKCNPGVCVELTVMSRVPTEELANILKPGCPLTKLKLSKYARCDEYLISWLCDKYYSTLRLFECFADVEGADHVLVRLVSEAKHLQNFVFLSTLNYTTAIEIAKVRGKHWKSLVFGYFSYEDKVNEIYGEDEVVSRNENGEYVLVAIEKFHRRELNPDEEETRRLYLCEEMSKILGYTWTNF